MTEGNALRWTSTGFSIEHRRSPLNANATESKGEVLSTENEMGGGAMRGEDGNEKPTNI